MALWIVSGKRFHSEVHPQAEFVFEGPFARVLVVFCALFIASRNLVAATVLTFCFFLTFRVLLNPESRFTVLPWFDHD